MEHARTTTTPSRIQGRNPIRKFLVAVGALLLSVGLALPAAADLPVPDSFTEVFTDVNPCTGEEQDFIIITQTRVHQHQKNIVVTGSRTGSTDGGFEIVNGTFHSAENKNTLALGLTDVWHNPTTGERFMANGTIVLDLKTLTVRVERFEPRCLG